MEILRRVLDDSRTAVLVVLAALLASFLFGYYLGRGKETLRTEVKEKVRYIRSTEVQRDTIYQPVPREIFLRDTIPKLVYTDTLALYAIWEDYHRTKKYDLDFSSDTIGTFRVEAEVERNSLVSAKSFVQPLYKEITRETTIYQAPKLQWNIGVGVSPDLKTQKIDLGADIRGRWYIGVSGINIDNNKAITFNAGVKL